MEVGLCQEKSTSDLREEWCSSVPYNLHGFSKMTGIKFPKGKPDSYWVLVNKKNGQPVNIHYRHNLNLFMSKQKLLRALEFLKQLVKGQKQISIVYCKGEERASGTEPISKKSHWWIWVDRRLNYVDGSQTTHSFIHSQNIYGVSTLFQKMLNITGSLTLRSSSDQELQN